MVQPKDVQGRIYRFKSGSECKELGIAIPVIPDVVRRHLVLVLDIVPGRRDYVKVMTITSTLKEDCEYVPIAPMPKKGYEIQLQLRNYIEWYCGQAVIHFTTLERNSYLKIDSSYEVPIQMLDQATDNSGYLLMIWAKHRGGLGELRNHVRRCDRFREEETLYQLMERQTLEENDI